MDVAVIGSPTFVLGFRLAGVRKTYPAEGPGEREARIEEVLKDPSVGILVLHNADYQALPATFRRRLADSVAPVVIPVGKEEETDLRERIKQAVGIDLWRK